MPDRRPPGASAFALMVLLCSAWGFQQVAIKVAIAGVSPILQAGLRSAVALVLVLAWARFRGVALAQPDRSLRPGLLAGLLFGAEFALIFFGLTLTSASRMVVFLYTAPCFTVLGLHWFVPGERVRWSHVFGLILAFGGVALAFADGWGRGGHWLGDLMGVGAAILWAATTVLIRATPLARISATKVLLYQLAVSAALLLPLSPLMGESGVTALTTPVLLSLAYQAVVVAFASYLAWFWLLTRYLASRLAVFSFLTPLTGVAFGVLLLDEPMTPAFGMAVAMVVAGIVLVNRVPSRRPTRA
ncbi:MAG: DMT family transporter [Betaproteobacteria bacterium]|nr:DMT family transporter [Betaproteobacteria bacterium]